MKNVWVAVILLFCMVMPVCGQTLPVSPQTEWTPFFDESFDSNSLGWPSGYSSEGGLQISREISGGNYDWNITASAPDFTWIGYSPSYPYENKRFRYTTEITLPTFTPYACAGILFNGDADGFYAYVVCNDKSYGLLQYKNGTLTNAVPYTALSDYDSFASSEISLEINDGWADFYYGDKLLDTYNTGMNYGKVGLVALPQSTDPLKVSFGSFTLKSTDAETENGFKASEIAVNASENMTRMIKMLNMKGRIDSSSGSFSALPDRELSLAMMGYSKKDSPILFGQDMLLQTEITWESAYDRPDYAGSGCGFYLRDLGNENYIEAYAAMDGAIYVNAWRWGSKVPIVAYSYDRWSVKGSGKLGIALDAQHITILWNDVLLGTITDATWIGTGDAGYLIHSGTNADYGTRCTFSNGEVYAFD